MSEPTPPAGRKPNVLTRKLGPLPTWAWVVIVAAIILGYVYLKTKKSGQQGPADTAGAGQVPQFVNQTFTQPGPPGPPDEDHDRDDDRDHDHDKDHEPHRRRHKRPFPRGRGEGPPSRKTSGPPIPRRMPPKRVPSG